MKFLRQVLFGVLTVVGFYLILTYAVLPLWQPRDQRSLTRENVYSLLGVVLFIAPAILSRRPTRK